MICNFLYFYQSVIYFVEIMKSNLELMDSIKNNCKISQIWLEGIAEGFDNLSGKKQISLGELTINGGQILFAGIGYCIFDNAAIEDAKQIVENVLIEAEKNKTPAVDKNRVIFNAYNPPIGFIVCPLKVGNTFQHR